MLGEEDSKVAEELAAADADLAAYDTYQAIAAIYDDFTFLNDYERWLGTTLLPQLGKHGLRRGTLLDVGCGTGRAFAPMLRRGWRIVGCDISPAMLSKAVERDAVELHVADMRELPTFGQFELVLCLNDAVNYLLNDGELTQALAGMGRNMSGQGGLLLFDCNSTSAFRAWYQPGSKTVEHGGRCWTWTGLSSGAGMPGATGVARIEGDDIEPIFNRARHYSPSEVDAALRDAGLQALAILGMREIDGRVVLAESVDESRDYKFVCIARLAS